MKATGFLIFSGLACFSGCTDSSTSGGGSSSGGSVSSSSHVHGSSTDGSSSHAHSHAPPSSGVASSRAVGSSSGASSAASGSGTGACVEEHLGTTADGDSVVVCDRLYRQSPHLRPPADEVNGDTVVTLYAAMMLNHASSGIAWVDRNGVEYAPVDAQGNVVELDYTNHTASVLPASLHLMSNRNMFLVYRLSGTKGTHTFDNGVMATLHATSVAPAYLLTGNAMDTLYMGAWEGTVSSQQSDNVYDGSTRLPVRMEFTSSEAMSNLDTWLTDNQLADGTRVAMVGHVTNLTAGVRGADGSCIPSFSSHGASNPFATATVGQVKLYRIAGMHGPGDQVSVLDFPDGISGNGMTNADMVGPIGILRVNPSADFMTLSMYPHGTPNGFRMDFRPVEGGGDGC